MGINGGRLRHFAGNHGSSAKSRASPALDLLRFSKLTVACHVPFIEVMPTEPIRVLVAEDDEISARAVQVMLERLRCLVEIVINGAQAVESFRSRRFDLVLMGWQMPVMDGFEATARIRALPRGQATPIIGTTAGRDRAECLAAGMNDLMPKPFRIEKLRLTLTRWTGWTDQKKNGECKAGVPSL